MTKKIFLIVISFLILSSCGYEPIYSKKNLNFSIGNIEKTNTSLNNQFTRVINSLNNKKTDDKINIKIESKKEIFIKSKNAKGDPLVFEVEIILEVLIIDQNRENKRTFSRKITYNNSDDKFKLRQYEKELEKILIVKIVEDLISYVSNVR